jgi:hypothetical protein
MPTYYVQVLPPPGEWLDPATCPFSPRDITADSEEDALAEARARLAEDANGADDGSDYREPSIGGWRIVAHAVQRPAIDLRPHGTRIDIVVDGVVRGQHFDYGEATNAESYDVLADDIVCGRLVRRDPIAAEASPGSNVVPLRSASRVWVIEDARGHLARFADHQWVDQSPAGLWKTLDWLESVLLDIREELDGLHA